MNNRTKASKIKGSGCGILLWNFRTKPVDDCQFGVIFFLIISTVLRVDSDFSMSATMVLQAWITVVLTGVTVVNQKAKINGDKITEYYVDIDLTFMIDRDRK